MAMFTTKQRDSLVEDLGEIWESLEKIHYLLDEVLDYFENTDADDKERKRAAAFASLLSDEVCTMQGYTPSVDWGKNLETVEQ